MNYRDYLEIMEFEKLEESNSTRFYTEKAKHWHKATLSLKKYDELTREKLKKKFQELKVENIIMAIDIARFEKEIGCKIDEDYEKAIESIALKRMKEG